MKINIKISLIIIFLFLVSKIVVAQTIYRSWFSENGNVCLRINETGYSTLCDLDNIIFKYNPKKRQLKMYHVWSYPKKNGKTVYLFEVEKLTNDSLVLIENSQKATFDYMGNMGRLIFISSDDGCDNLWIRYNLYLKPSNQK